VPFDVDRDAVYQALAGGFTPVLPKDDPRAVASRQWMLGFIHQPTGIGVDLMFMHPHGDMVRLNMGWPDHIGTEMPAYGLEMLRWQDRDWPMPSPPERYLEGIYGPGWRKPERHYDTQVSNPSRTPESLPRAVTLGLMRLVEAVRAGQWAKADALGQQILAREDLAEVRRLRARLPKASDGAGLTHGRWCGLACVSCLIPAAGAGLRLRPGHQGVTCPCAGRPLLCWVADKALQVADEVIVAVPGRPPGGSATRLLPRCRVLAGGGSRHDSVALLAEQARGDWLLLQDVARPFASVGLTPAACIEAARATGCAGAFVDPEVPVARLRDGFAVEALPRHEAGVFQSPQAFRPACTDLLALIERERAEGWQPQSTMQLALRAGLRVAAGRRRENQYQDHHRRRLAARDAALEDYLSMSSGNHAAHPAPRAVPVVSRARSRRPTWSHATRVDLPARRRRHRAWRWPWSRAPATTMIRRPRRAVDADAETGPSA
jgi:2-C-methyl-D-erythritol 4-phosphate cytidylyltransferase